MGCGACAYSQISDSNRTLHQRLLQKIANIKNNNLTNDMKKFISLDQLKIIENGMPISETIAFEQLNRLQAGEQYLLSKQRRIAWKLSIYQYVNFEQFHSFTETPTTKNQKTKSRFHEISLDINRTFSTINQLNKKNLTNVLQNLTLCFEGLGYTQGMNFYIGFLLLCGFTPEQSYQIFVRLSNKKQFLLIRNFSQNFKNINCCITVMENIMRNSSNKVFNQILLKIESFGLNLFLFVFSWFLSYFLYNFNLKTSLLTWDYIILFPTRVTGTPEMHEGPAYNNFSLFGCGYVNAINLALKIMEQLAQKILACSQINQIMAILRHDSIESYVDPIKVGQLIAKCRSDPIIDWNQFKSNCQTADQQLFNIICDLELTGESPPKGYFIAFMNECKHLQRSNLQSTNFQ